MQGDSLRRLAPPLYRMYLSATQRRFDGRLLTSAERSRIADGGAKVLIIQISNPALGLMGIYNAVLGYLRLAAELNLPAVVDLQSRPNGYLQANEVGVRNAWDYYFQQPSSWTLAEAQESDQAVVVTGLDPREAAPSVLNFWLERDPARRRRYSRIVNDSMSLSAPAETYVRRAYDTLLDGRRAIGVVKRGTDLVGSRGHAVQPPIYDLIDRTRQALTKWDCDFVFLATEEESSVTAFRAAFGSGLIVNDAARVRDYQRGTDFVDVSFGRPSDRYLKGLEYLTTVALLSRCTGLIGSLVGATVSARVMNDGRFEHVDIIDLGVYD